MTKTVLVCDAQVPFVQGGAELLVNRRADSPSAPLIVPALTHAARRVRPIVAGDGPLRRQLEELAPACDLADRVTFPGRTSEPQARPAQSLGDAGYDRARSITWDVFSINFRAHG